MRVVPLTSSIFLSLLSASLHSSASVQIKHPAETPRQPGRNAAWGQSQGRPASTRRGLG